MAAITDKGTSRSKTSTTTLAHNDVRVLAGHSLLVGLGYETDQGDPTVKWGNQLLVPVETVTGNGIKTRIAVYRRRRPVMTSATLKATWKLDTASGWVTE